jgi:hypothetical protein
LQHRTRLLDPDAILTQIGEDGALCELQGLPPALADVVDRACIAAADEPLRQALLDAQARIGNLQSRVNSVANQVAAIPQNVVNALCSEIPGC